MKNKIFIALILISVLMLFYELINLDFHFYKSHFNSQGKSDWNSSKSVSRIGNSNEVLPDLQYAIVVKHDSTLIGDVDSDNPTCIDISSTDFGPMWIPFYKKSDFSILTTVENSYDTKTDSTIRKIQIIGNINITGEYKIIGLCTYKKARSLIIEKAMNEIYESAKKNIK